MTPKPPKKDPFDLVGSTVADKYLVESVAGEGGFSVVYRAQHTIWKRPVALKMFKLMGDLATQDRDRVLEGFVQEGSLLAQLSERSAAICQARDIGTATTARGDWVPFMVLEWLEGDTLDKVIEREKGDGLPPRTLTEAVHLLDGAAKALAIAHGLGIAHRDVKPGNFFVLGDPRGDDAQLKILDFGIAKVVGDAQKAAGFQRTQGKVTAFTPAYGAPEQFSRSYGSTGPWTDVFALSLVLLELISGWEPLSGDDFAQFATASADPARRPTPKTFHLEVSDAVESVFLRAVAIKPADRYSSVGEFWSALREALGLGPLRGVDTTRSHPLLAPPSSPSSTPITSTGIGAGGAPAPSRALLFAGVALGAVAIAGAGIFFAMRGGTGASQSSVTAADARSPVSSSAAIAPAPAAPIATTCADGMVKIPGGRFFMGTDDKNAPAFERPAHQVTLAPFCIDKHEANTGDYRDCSDHGECKRASDTNDWDGITDVERKAYDPLCNVRDVALKQKHPINCVDWEDAVQFCRSRGKRLPTEAEWEYAARGPDGRAYPWGDEAPSAQLLNACGKECVAWGKKNGVKLEAMYASDDGWAATAPVGSFPNGASRYGVEDVVGNVWEWVADWYAEYTDVEDVDPAGPERGDKRVIRGGAWNGQYASWVRPTFRYRDAPNKKSHGIGFRCAKSL